jgi:hypothetical protein
MGTCPRCGGSGRVVDGTYDFMDGVLTALDAPAWSAARLRDLEAQLRAAQRGQVPADTALEDLSVSSPELRSYIQTAKAVGLTAAQIILAILTVLSFVQSTGAERKLDQIEHREQRIERLLETMAHPAQAAPTASATRRSRAAVPKRPKKPAKSHGKAKRKRR